jgi:hypothetical protein
MMRNLMAAACGAVLALLYVAPAPASSPLVGSWSTTIDWENRKAGLYIILAITADGRIRERVSNHAGMAYALAGTYRMDAAGQTMRFTWTDYSPKAICVGGNCTRMGPPEPLGVAHTSRIRFGNPNFFIGTTDDGTSTKWIRMH